MVVLGTFASIKTFLKTFTDQDLLNPFENFCSLYANKNVLFIYD